MDSNNNSHSTNVSTDYRYSEQDGDQTSWQLSHTFYNDSFSHKELGVTVGGLNTDTINSAVNGRWDGQYGNVATGSDSYDRNYDHLWLVHGYFTALRWLLSVAMALIWEPVVQTICWVRYWWM